MSLARTDLEAFWMPRASEAGLEQFAHVIAPSFYSALSAQDMHRRSGPYFHMKIFGEIEKAKAWLQSFQKKEKNELKEIKNFELSL